MARQRSLVRVAVSAVCLSFGLLPCAAGAQDYPAGACQVSYDSETQNAIGFLPETTDVKVTGTFNCFGVVVGTLCATGTVNGNCAENTNSAYVLNCDGTCTADFGNSPDRLTCNGSMASASNVSHVSGNCVGSLCVSQSEGPPNPYHYTSVVVADSPSLTDSFAACNYGGPGITKAHFSGLILATP